MKSVLIILPAVMCLSRGNILKAEKTVSLPLGGNTYIADSRDSKQKRSVSDEGTVDWTELANARFSADETARKQAGMAENYATTVSAFTRAASGKATEFNFSELEKMAE